MLKYILSVIYFSYCGLCLANTANKELILPVNTWSAAVPGDSASLWDLDRLFQSPTVEWMPANGNVQELYYSNEPFKGKNTRVFAYLARPASNGPHPAIVLVHGGGGAAFKLWAEQWAERGYVAIAMDLSGNGPNKQPLADGGPKLSTEGVFARINNQTQTRNSWTYHAVSAVIRAHSLLRSLPDIDVNRIAISGISWGGYITEIVMGLDNRFAVGVPVYGSGFLYESSYWKTGSIDIMNEDERKYWIRYFDPSSYLSNVKIPVLFVTGTNDPRFFLNSHRLSYLLVPPHFRYVSLQKGLKHGHYFEIPEVINFIECVLQRRSTPLRILTPVCRDGKVISKLEGNLNDVISYSAFVADNSGEWKDRKWDQVAAGLSKNNEVVIDSPSVGKLLFFSLQTNSGLIYTSHYIQL